MESVISGPMRTRLERLRDDEMSAFNAAIPRSRAWLESARNLMPNGVPVSWMSGFWRHSPVVAVSGSGSTFADLDGRRYRDFNLCDLAMAAGFAPPAIVEAISRQAALGNHFLLPPPRTPQRSVTCSGSGSRCQRGSSRCQRPEPTPTRCAWYGRSLVTRRSWSSTQIHGHLDELLWTHGEPDGVGLPEGSGRHVVTIPFNDTAALEAAVAGGDVAAVVLEPVMTNCGLVMPQQGFPAYLRAVTRERGTMVIADVTHTQFAVYGGGAHGEGLDPDVITGGKGIGGGVPVGVFGMTRVLADYLAAHVEGDFVDAPAVPTGGTLYANALSMAAARAGLAEIFTPEAHRSRGLARSAAAARSSAAGGRLRSTVRDRPLGGSSPVASQALEPPVTDPTATSQSTRRSLTHARRSTRTAGSGTPSQRPAGRLICCHR